MSVRTDAAEGVLTITLDRPAARNAIDLAAAQGIAAALDRLDGDGALRAGILTGSGGNFCAGMDLKAFARGERPHAGDRGFAGIVRTPPSKPIVAAIEGYAVGGGLEIALACDLIVAARDSRLGLPEVKRSLVAAGGALIRLPRRIPYHLAKELALTGELVDAGRAHAAGLVNRLAQPGEALATARELAAAIAANGPLGVVASKRILVECAGLAEEDAWAHQATIADPVF